jgi:hypothetical protein
MLIFPFPIQTQKQLDDDDHLGAALVMKSHKSMTSTDLEKSKKRTSALALINAVDRLATQVEGQAVVSQTQQKVRSAKDSALAEEWKRQVRERRLQHEATKSSECFRF